MKLCAPKYYKKFRCIADKCEHNCCVGWEIDVDESALEKYIAQNNALKDIETLNQKSIDHIFDNSRKKSDDLFPKGIQERTLIIIMEYLNSNKGKWFTGDDIDNSADSTRSENC